MKTFNTLALASSLIFASSTVNAAKVETAGQAMSLCKTQAEQTHPNHKRIKSTRIKQRRGEFKITLKVITDNEKLKTICEVNKDGLVNYEKA